jgi:hypothetical protein
MWRSTEDLFGKAIDYYNRKTFPNQKWLPTHVGIISYVDEKKGIVTIHEAGPKGFLASDYPIEWLNQKVADEHCKFCETNEKLVNVYENCEKYKGIKYGWLDILGIAMSFIFGYKVIGITGKNAIICSEAVCRILYDCSKQVNFEQEYGIKFDAITPAHIYLSLQVRHL